MHERQGERGGRACGLGRPTRLASSRLSASARVRCPRKASARARFPRQSPAQGGCRVPRPYWPNEGWRRPDRSRPTRVPPIPRPASTCDRGSRDGGRAGLPVISSSKVSGPGDRGGRRRVQVADAAGDGQPDLRSGQPGRDFLGRGKAVKDGLRRGERGAIGLAIAVSRRSFQGGGHEQDLWLCSGRHAPELSVSGCGPRGSMSWPIASSSMAIRAANRQSPESPACRTASPSDPFG